MVVRLPGAHYILLLIALLPAPLRAQQPTGTIAGTVTDPTGARIARASVSIVSLTTALVLEASTTAAGVYAVAGLVPGAYQVHFRASGFRQTVVSTEVEVGRTSTLDAQLQVGPTADSITVSNESVRVDTSQATLQGIITERQIRELPLNGRNFLDLGQLEPGVQLNPNEFQVRPNFVRLSSGGQSGITTRTTVDGLDTTEEVWGSVTANWSLESLKEFQVSRSSFDPATGLTGSAAVNVATRSGGNDMHGSGFVFWRDDKLAARIGDQPTPFDREQFGFRLGGPFLRDRLFWFAAYERNNQDAATTTNFPMFPQLNGTWQVPYDERMALARLDANVSRGIRLIGRFSHHWSDGIFNVGGMQLVPQFATNQTNQTALGLDAAGGHFTHSFRFGYTNYSLLSDSALDRYPGLPVVRDSKGRTVGISFGGSTGGIAIAQQVPAIHDQDSYELRYDGAYSIGRHSLRWGALVNFIRAYLYQPIFSLAPNFGLTVNDSTISKCGSDILCYPVQLAQVGNGLGYFTELPSLGFPYGGILNDRVHWYIADSWRANPRLTLNFGLRWVYEPAPDNPDLQKASDTLNSFRPGLGAQNPRNLDNFAPQLGIAWDPTGSGKTVIRAGAGIFYDFRLLRDVIFERQNSLPPGIARGFVNVLKDPVRDPLDPSHILVPVINPAIACAGSAFLNRCQLGQAGFMEYVWDVAFATMQAAAQNSYDVFPSGPAECETTRSCVTFSPDYHTPYSFQFNIGLQRELRPGLVLSVDYVRNRSLRYNLRTDLNRVGAADTLDAVRALAAMNRTFANFKVGGVSCSNISVYPTLAAQINCTIAARATIASYVANGLGAGAFATNAAPSIAAFPGMDPAFNRVEQIASEGISTYDALQVNLRGRLPNLGHVLRDNSIVASYAFSRLEGIGGEDQASYWATDPVNNDNPGAWRGPTNLDRTHMLTVSGSFTVPGGLRMNSIWRAFSALPQNLLVPGTGGGNAEIFYTDFNGDGYAGDPLPGSQRGDYGRRIGCGAGAVNPLIDAYNRTQAGQLTPAGQALVNAGLFTTAQLKSLGAVSPQLKLAPDSQVCSDAFLTTDMRISRPFHLHGERVTIEPGLDWFNIFNVANYDLPGDRLTGGLSGTPGSVNGTPLGTNPYRASGAGGSFALGAPRSWQLSVRVTF